VHKILKILVVSKENISVVKVPKSAVHRYSAGKEVKNYFLGLKNLFKGGRK